MIPLIALSKNMGTKGTIPQNNAFRRIHLRSQRLQNFELAQDYLDNTIVYQELPKKKPKTNLCIGSKPLQRLGDLGDLIRPLAQLLNAKNLPSWHSNVKSLPQTFVTGKLGAVKF
jgi:hypothetical protein